MASLQLYIIKVSEMICQPSGGSLSFSPVLPAQLQKILLCMTQIGSFPAAHGYFPAWLSFQPEIDNSRSCLCKNPWQQGTAYLSQDHAVLTDIAAGGKEHLGLEPRFAKKGLLQLEHGGPAGDQDKRILQKAGKTDLGRILSLCTSQTG